MYDGAFSDESLEAGLEWLSRRGTVGSDPDLASRDWSYVGAQHLNLYRTLLSEGSVK